MTPETALLDAVTAALLATAGVTGLVGQKVFDQVPDDKQAPRPPYLYVGPINRTRVTEVCDGGAWALRARLYAVSTGFGRKQAWEMADAVARALDGQELDLPDPFTAVDPVRVTQAGDVLTPASPKAIFVDIAVTIQE